MICFHGVAEKNGYLSNWYPSEFEVDGVHFNCMEQYMMYAKAVLFNDKIIAGKILKEQEPNKIKALGRRVAHFSDKVWDKSKEELVYKGLLAKFSQNKELEDKLLATGDDTICECAVWDKVWGIGLSMHDSARLNPKQWRGKNLLGKLLMKVREELKGLQ